MTNIQEKNTLKVPQINYYGTGKRKCAIAKVWLFEGNGVIQINDLDPSAYFGSQLDAKDINKPLLVTSNVNKFNIKVKVLGGGKSAQIDAIILGISRALLQLDETMRDVLKPNGFLTRDARVKERKKYGLRKARKAPQYRKR